MTATAPNTCIDQREIGANRVSLYKIWPTFGGGYIVTARNGHEISRVQYDNEADARSDFNGWAQAWNAQAEYRDEAPELDILNELAAERAAIERHDDIH